MITSDGTATTEEVTVYLEITNAAPWTADRDFSLAHDTSFSLIAPGLLQYSGDADAEALTISVVNPVTQEVEFRNVNSLTYPSLYGVTIDVTISDLDGSDTIEVYFGEAGVQQAPVFTPDTYALFVTDATTNGETIGTVIAADSDLQPGQQLDYALSSVLSPFLAVSNSGVVSVTDAAGLRAAISANSPPVIQGTATVADPTNLQDTATVSVYIENDALDIANLIQVYINNQWTQSALIRAQNGHEVSEVVIEAKYVQLKSKVDDLTFVADSSLDLLSAFGFLIPVPVLGGVINVSAVMAQTAVNARAQAAIQTSDEFRLAALSESTAILTHTTTEITNKRDAELVAWQLEKNTVIDVAHPAGSVARAQAYAEYFSALVNSLPLPPSLVPTAQEVIASLGL